MKIQEIEEPINEGLAQFILNLSSGYWRAQIIENLKSGPLLDFSNLLYILAESPKEDDRKAVAANKEAPNDLLTKLSQDPLDIVRVQVAGHPNTSITILEELSNEPEVNIRAAVAGNPNTSSQVLLKLSQTADDDILLALARNSSTPHSVLASLSCSESKTIRAAVAYNRSTPNEVLATLVQDQESFVLWNLAQNPNTPQEVLAALKNDEEGDINRALAVNPSTPAKTLTDLSRYGSATLSWGCFWSSLLQNPSLPEPVYSWIIEETLGDKHKMRISAFYVVAEKCTQEEYLVKLHTKVDELGLSLPKETMWVKHKLLNNPKTPEWIRELYLKDKDDHVRAIALELCSSKDLLDEMSSDKSTVVKMSVAANQHSSLKTLEKLANDASEEVRSAVACNLAISSSLSEKLANDKSLSVRTSLIQNPTNSIHNFDEVDQVLSVLKDNSYWRVFAIDQRTPSYYLNKLSDGGTEDIREAVASNPNLSPVDLVKLASDKSAKVRIAVCRNTNVSIETLEMLSKDRSKKVQIQAVAAQGEIGIK